MILTINIKKWETGPSFSAADPMLSLDTSTSFAVLFLALGFLAVRPVLAQQQKSPPSKEFEPGTDDAEGSAQTEDGGPTPPRIVSSPQPDFPASALQEGRTRGSVGLKIKVGLDGKVHETEVVESAGPVFDDAAKQAALKYVFEPATIKGRATAAFILLRIDFHAPVDPATSTSSKGSPAAASPPAHRSRPLHAEQESGEQVTREPAGANPSSSADPPSDKLVEVTITGYSEADRLRRSAEAVHVVETEEAKRQSQDLGEVLARTQGVGVQRSSGLGSDTRISMNGLTDDQIRFFLDGVPLKFMGYPFGIANVPVNLVERIEIYRGVVPVRFGADALGGAINLVSDHDLEEGLHGATSFQAGSFGTVRSTVSGQHFGRKSGFLTRIGAFQDLAENNYPMNVVVPDASGQEVPARVYRFHDAYQARGANVEAGILNKRWAKRLSLRGFITDHAKEVQHNLLMTFNPYGDVKYEQTTFGGLARYDNVFLKQLILRTVAGYTNEQTSYSDLGECVYDWFGQCIRERAQPGERIGRAQDQDYLEHNVYGRVTLEWLVHPIHSLQLSVAPTYTERSGTEHRLANPDARDPLSAERKLGGVVTGLESKVELLDRKLENRLFLKDYVQSLRSEDPLTNGVDFRREDRTTHRAGYGDSVRYAFFEWLYAKASYEWATRLPRADEIFGNAFPVAPNLQLRPETSHNVNLGATVEGLETLIGSWDADVNGFLRDAEDLIRIVGDDDSASYQNVASARSLGVESSLAWTSPRDYVSLGGNATYVDFRNTSKGGPDADYVGDRIPNRPYFFATGSARLKVSHVADPQDELSLTWTSRYVHSFFRGWESIGTDKPVVPQQLLHSLALTYFIEGDPADLSFSGEGQNLTDAEAYDYFGVPKPGRAFYFKVTASL